MLTTDMASDTEMTGTSIWRATRSAVRCRVPVSEVGMLGSGTRCTLPRATREQSAARMRAPSILASSDSRWGVNSASSRNPPEQTASTSGPSPTTIRAPLLAWRMRSIPSRRGVPGATIRNASSSASDRRNGTSGSPSMRVVAGPRQPGRSDFEGSAATVGWGRASGQGVQVCFGSREAGEAPEFRPPPQPGEGYGGAEGGQRQEGEPVPVGRRRRDVDRPGRARPHGPGPYLPRQGHDQPQVQPVRRPDGQQMFDPVGVDPGVAEPGGESGRIAEPGGGRRPGPEVGGPPQPVVAVEKRPAPLQPE